MNVLQDWVQLAQLIGDHLGTPTLVGVDAQGRLITVIQDPETGNYVNVDVNGYLTSVIKGDDSGTLRTVAVDSDGNLIALIKDPTSGNYVNVDANGFLSSVMKGDNLGTLRTVAVDSNGNLIALLKDPISGNYIGVDANGYLTTVVKGNAAGTLKTITVDANGNIVNIIKDPTSGNYLAVDNNGYLTSVIKGDDSGTLRTVAVDSNGKLIGVFQGQYGTEYKVLQTDEQGRLLAVLSDPNDVWNYSRQMGLAELSARINQLFAYDKRGDAIWYTNFDNGLSGLEIEGYTSVPMQYYLLHTNTILGRQRLYFRTSGEGNNIVEMTRSLINVSNSKTGLGVLFSGSDSNIFIDLKIIIETGTVSLQSVLRIRLDNLYIQCIDPYNNLVYVGQIPGASYLIGMPLFIKYVIDPITRKYVRVIVAGIEMDLSNYYFRYTNSNLIPHIKIVLVFGNTTGSVSFMSLHGIIFTQNEP